MGHKERIEYGIRLLRSQGPNASSFNHQLGKSHQGTDRHTLGLGHINCHLFSSAELKGHKILLNINVLLLCEPPTFKDFAGQMPAGWALAAQSMATAGMQPAIFVQKYGSSHPSFQKCPLEGKTPPSLQESCRIWLSFHDNGSNNKNLFSCAKTRRKAEQLLAAHKLPATFQICSSIPSWSPLAPQPLPFPSA